MDYLWACPLQIEDAFAYLLVSVFFVVTHTCLVVAHCTVPASCPTSDHPGSHLSCVNDAAVTIHSTAVQNGRQRGPEAVRGGLFWTLALACEVGTGITSVFHHQRTRIYLWTFARDLACYLIPCSMNTLSELKWFLHICFRLVWVSFTLSS